MQNFDTCMTLTHSTNAYFGSSCRYSKAVTKGCIYTTATKVVILCIDRTLKLIFAN